MFRKANKVVLRRLQFLMLIRIIIISIILGITVLLQLKEGRMKSPLADLMSDEDQYPQGDHHHGCSVENPYCYQ